MLQGGKSNVKTFPVPLNIQLFFLFFFVLFIQLSLSPHFQIFPGLILSDIKPAKRMKFKTVCYLLVQLMHCRKMFKAEIPFSNAMTCDDDDKVDRLVVKLSLFKNICMHVCTTPVKSRKKTIWVT